VLELDGAEIAGWTDDSLLEKVFTINEGIHGTRRIGMPCTAQPDESEEFDQMEVEATASRK